MTDKSSPAPNDVQETPSKETEKAPIIGIDLGTTNSLISYIKDGSPRIIPNDRGERITPSVVFFKETGEVVVGQMAKNQAVLNSDSTVTHAKLAMGTGKTYVIHGKTYIPRDISAYILSSLKETAERYLSKPVKDAVITVPAYFSEKQREDTLQSAQQAGLNVLKLLNEPTAAALIYGFSRKADTRLLVLDLGGGTFDLTLMDYQDKIFRVKGVGGATDIGGINFDRVLVEQLLSDFKATYGIDLSVDKIALQQLVIHAEKTKIDLSSSDETQIMIPYITVTPKGPVHLNVPLTRERFEHLIEPILKRIGRQIWQTFKEAELTPPWVDAVILVGGSTRLPAIEALVKQIIIQPRNLASDGDPETATSLQQTAFSTENQLKRNINPDEAVVRGAGILAGILEGSIKDIAFHDITPHDLGVEDDNGNFITIIPKGTAYPAKSAHLFTTTQDHQASVIIHVQQRLGMAEDKLVSLGFFELKTDPAKKKGESNIDVTFRINGNGLLKVSALDIDSHEEETLTVQSDKVLFSSPVDPMEPERKNGKEESRL